MRLVPLLIAGTAFVSAVALAQAQSPQGAQTVVEQAQQKLTALGYKPGQPNGIENKKTQEAVKRFQKSQKLDVNGRLDTQTLAALGVRPATTVARSAPPSEQLSGVPGEPSSAPLSSEQSSTSSSSASPSSESSAERTAEPASEQSQS